MSLFIDASYESINKYNEELCGDKVEILRDKDSVIVVLADGLGSGVKANILATLTSKIIGTMLMKGSGIEEAVETIASTLPVCKERGIAYSTFSILQVFNSGEAYLAEFDNPSVLCVKRGKVFEIPTQEREINGKLVKESRFIVNAEDMFIMISDGVIHAGIGGILNLGWQWENVSEYVQRTYNNGLTSKNMTKLLLSVCENLYMQKPGDDTTVVSVKIRKPLRVSVMVGPPVDRADDGRVVEKFMDCEGKKVVCGGTTSQILSRELGKEISTNFNYFNPSIPPTAEIEGIDLTTEGVLTLGRALEYMKKCLSLEGTIQDFLKLNKEDGASRLTRILLNESTNISFYVGRAMNPAHQNPEFPLALSIKLKLVEEMAECLQSVGKQVEIEYY
ncbi:stage II sporulation protein E [Anaerobacterium chartisolvens]|uniref:Stage II sporulation protein E n=1 Tax=Anaerobacterium chartisolvens TaxID=1297424 RepID=A0A369AMS7_9FIRM|nr:SpoIIE family protein phosphatase [Anaerobacterium chartisolvens]RCX09628.1 stage II sporulation protein E [Anaerobacterium chartisolvens]